MTSSQKNRLAGGLLDRSQPVSFQFDGQTYAGYVGDTLASALLANDVRLMGRSFKYHRPRGPMTAGSEEPNALVTLGTGGRQEPNTRATTVELFDQLSARPQNCWPSLRFDALSVNDRVSGLLTAGFYYKTFMWPAGFWEKVYEPLIRKAAGLGSLSLQPDPDTYHKGFLHCDLLVIGSGPAGLTAALTAGRAGMRVIICEEDFLTGGRLNVDTTPVGDRTGVVWAADITAELATMPRVRVMKRTTVIGAFDHGIYGAVERVADHAPMAQEHQPRQILWRIYSKQALLCAGATERSIVFENNDRPGIMLAGAMRAYVNRWAAAPAKKVTLFTNNDSAYQTAFDLQAKGIQIAAVVDVRPDAPASDTFEVIKGAQVTQTSGRLGLTDIEVKKSDGTVRYIICQALGVSGGWNPVVHMTCHHGHRPVWRPDIAAFVPGDHGPAGLRVAGAANGDFSTSAALSAGMEAALQSAEDLGFKAHKLDLPETEDTPIRVTPFWCVPGTKRGWVDQQNDVTSKDIVLAHQENFVSVEHLKRYTTLGMATDQGKTSNVLGLAIMADVSGRAIPEVGTTLFRPPYTPVSLGVLAGLSRDETFKPVRRTPSHAWAQEQGAVFVETGLWLRAQWFPQPGETHWRQSVDREVTQTRHGVGICDVTTLGKIDVQGADVVPFLNRVYGNGFDKLPVGKVKYGVMLREDGIVMDDGTAAHFAPNHFIVTTSTANAVAVYRHMEFVRQCLCPDMDVQLISTTESWAQFAVAGPHSRSLLQKVIGPETDLSNEGFPFMACGPITVDGVRGRLFRVTFSGELAYEIAIPTRYADALIRKMMQAGRPFGVSPYGTEAMGVMRIEKGHAAGNEINGTTTALNMGLERMISKKKDAIGVTLSRRPDLMQEDALRLVGLKPADTNRTIRDMLPAGAHLMSQNTPVDAAHDQGYITSACYSPTLGHPIALGYLKSGTARIGEVIRVVSPLTGVDHLAQVTEPCFIDPKGERARV